MTPEHAALCERLKAALDLGRITGADGGLRQPANIYVVATQAAAAIERLSAENEAWDWLAKNESLELAFGYGPEPEDPGEWRVHERGGNINDREWTLISSGATPLQAVQAARTLKGADQ